MTNAKKVNNKKVKREAFSCPDFINNTQERETNNETGIETHAVLIMKAHRERNEGDPHSKTTATSAITQYLRFRNKFKYKVSFVL